jgi:hypothetical protein
MSDVMGGYSERAAFWSAVLARLPKSGTGPSVLVLGETVPELANSASSIQHFAPSAHAASQDVSQGVRVLDVERQFSDATVDYAICSLSSMAFRNPLHAIDVMALSCREGFFMLIEEPPAVSRWELDLTVLLQRIMRKLPGMFLMPSQRRHAMDQGFMLTPSLIQAYMKSMRQDFAYVEFVKLGSRTWLLSGKRRKIKNLHILAGVNAVGKSTFLKKLRAGESPEVAEALGLSALDDFKLTTYADLLRNSDQTRFDKLLVQYNITAPAVHGKLHAHHHGLLDLVRSAEACSITTMWLPHEVQHERYFADRIPQSVFSPELHLKRKLAKQSDRGGKADARANPFYVRSLYARRKAHRLMDVYGSRKAFENMYEEWMSFTETCTRNSFVLFQSPEYSVGSVAHWRDQASSGDHGLA